MQVRNLLQQLFSLVNRLLLRPESCSFSNGDAEVEGWIHGAGKERVGDSREDLKVIRQAVTLVVCSLSATCSAAVSLTCLCW